METKTVAILQSNYIPWKGYFDLIRSVDEFILLDDVQYTKRDWRNRNLIKINDGLKWLTIPVHVKGRFHQKINETEVLSGKWATQHWKILTHHYKRGAGFARFEEPLRELYVRSAELKWLTEINLLFLRTICEWLRIKTPIRRSEDFKFEFQSPTDRLIKICNATLATRYLSGPSAKAYLQSNEFRKSGLELSYFEYGPYPEYRQIYPSFTHQLSILDLLLNTGESAYRYLKTVDEEATVPLERAEVQLSQSPYAII